jgi:uncharacterized protein
VTAEYSGTARFAEKDEQTYRAVIDARGRDSRGNGNASAVISAQLLPEGESTRVTVTTDLTIAGRIAQFGSGMIKEVSAKLLGQFTDCLEGRLGGDLGVLSRTPFSVPDVAGPPPVAVAASASQTPAATAASSTAAAFAGSSEASGRVVAGDGATAGGVAGSGAVVLGDAEPAALDLMSVAGSAISKRLVPVVVGLVVLGVVIYLIVR